VRPLTIVVGNPGLTKALRDGSTPCAHLTLNFIPVDPLIAAMRRMVRDLAFDICEMALSTYLCARNFAKPFTAIPVFPARNFHHRAMFRNVNSGIDGPRIWKDGPSG
jgi:4,5-dihydroxyphthalate decarboxylase